MGAFAAQGSVLVTQGITWESHALSWLMMV